MESTHFDRIDSYYKQNVEAVMRQMESISSINRSDNYKILGWESRSAQYGRFAVFARSFDLRGATVLDVGCGLGDLYHFLTQGLGLSFDYTGTDILPDMITRAKMQLDEVPLPENVKAFARFLCTDVFVNAEGENALLGKTVDYVYASGIFNLSLGNNMEFLHAAFLRFCEYATKGFCCSLLSDASTDKENTYFYYNASAVESVLRDVAKQYPGSTFDIVSGYLPNDFTVCFRK